MKHSQTAEALVKAYESKLYEEDSMDSDVKSIETVISTLKVKHYLEKYFTNTGNIFNI